mgnify:FL=1
MGECILDFNTQKILGRPVKILRFGKRTESYIPISPFSDFFVQALEVTAETKTQNIIPTKFLTFNKEIANLLKKTKSTLLFSIGFDEYELGALEYGCNNEFRLEQALKYKQAGVNSIIYLLAVANKAPDKRENNIFKFAEKNKIKVQILPMRFSRKDLTLKLTGVPWDILKDDSKQPTLLKDHYEESRGSYYYENSCLTVRNIHPFWLNLIKDNNKENFRMCHHDSEDTYCGGCFHKKGIIIPTKEVSKQKFKNNYNKRKTAKNLEKKLF